MTQAFGQLSVNNDDGCAHSVGVRGCYVSHCAQCVWVTRVMYIVAWVVVRNECE